MSLETICLINACSWYLMLQSPHRQALLSLPKHPLNISIFPALFSFYREPLEKKKIFLLLLRTLNVWKNQTVLQLHKVLLKRNFNKKITSSSLPRCSLLVVKCLERYLLYNPSCHRCLLKRSNKENVFFLYFHYFI